MADAVCWLSSLFLGNRRPIIQGNLNADVRVKRRIPFNKPCTPDSFHVMGGNGGIDRGGNTSYQRLMGRVGPTIQEPTGSHYRPNRITTMVRTSMKPLGVEGMSASSLTRHHCGNDADFRWDALWGNPTLRSAVHDRLRNAQAPGLKAPGNSKRVWARPRYRGYVRALSLS